MRDGGTQQNGQFNGIRLTYDRIKPLYLGADYLNGVANLKGHSGAQRRIVSELTDQVYEGRIGYTFFEEDHFFSLFTGYGYFHEENDFRSPTPIPFKFTNTFNYIPVGFLSGVNFSTLLSMGVNFKMMFMQEAKTKVTEDPARENVIIQMNEEINVRVEVPLILSLPKARLGLRFGCIPFFEYRHYGGREGFPFNYVDTKYTQVGARLALLTRF